MLALFSTTNKFKKKRNSFHKNSIRIRFKIKVLRMKKRSEILLWVLRVKKRSEDSLVGLVLKKVAHIPI